MLDNHSTGGVKVDPARGPWSQKGSGKKFYFLDPRPEDIDLEDIMSCLSKLCRFNGDCDEFYSVAQHSVIMAELAAERGLSDEIQVICLLHDATEAYVGDVVRPLKSLLSDYRKIEDQTWVAIADHFDLPHQMPLEVKFLDDLMVSTEKDQMLPKASHWPNLPEPMTKLIFPLDPGEAYVQFSHHCGLLGLQ